MQHLFQPLELGALTLPNRICMAPLTRCRADREHVPTLLMAEHYAQRASAGLEEGSTAPGLHPPAGDLVTRGPTDRQLNTRTDVAMPTNTRTRRPPDEFAYSKIPARVRHHMSNPFDGSKAEDTAIHDPE